MLRMYALLSERAAWDRTGSLDGSAALSTTPLVWKRFFARHNVDQKVEHVRFAQCARNVRSLKGTTLVLFSMYPCAHSELRNEYVAAFREENGRFGGDHLDLWVGFHDLLDTRQWQLVKLVVVFVRLQLRDLLLPVRVEDVAIGAIESLIHLQYRQPSLFNPCVKRGLTFCHAPVNNCGSGACPCAAIYGCQRSRVTVARNAQTYCCGSTWKQVSSAISHDPESRRAGTVVAQRW